jgi:hypothetical protein
MLAIAILPSLAGAGVHPASVQLFYLLIVTLSIGWRLIYAKYLLYCTYGKDAGGTPGDRALDREPSAPEAPTHLRAML